jgi:Tat protein translocase TatB subunit
MDMFGIGFPELIVILVVALLVVGPSKLPEVARSIGKALRELRRITDEAKESIEREMDWEKEPREGVEETQTVGEAAGSTSDSQRNQAADKAVGGASSGRRLREP